MSVAVQKNRGSMVDHMTDTAKEAPECKTSARELRCIMIEPGTNSQAIALQRDENNQLYQDCAKIPVGSEVYLVPDKEAETFTLVFNHIPEYAPLHLQAHLNRIFKEGVEGVWLTREKMTIVLTGLPDTLDPRVDAYIATLEPQGKKETVSMHRSSGGTDVIRPKGGPMTLAQHRKSTGKPEQEVSPEERKKTTRELASDALKQKYRG